MLTALGSPPLQHGPAPPARKVRLGGLPKAQAKLFDPNTPPLDQLVHNPFFFILADIDNDGGHCREYTRLGATNPSMTALREPADGQQLPAQAGLPRGQADQHRPLA